MQTSAGSSMEDDHDVDANEESPLMAPQSDHHGTDEAALHVDSEREHEAKLALSSVSPGFLLGAFVISFDISYCMANYSRRIASDLGQLDNAVWIPLSGSVSEAAFQPLYGYFTKLYGRTRPAIVAISCLTVGFLLCGLSQTLWQLALARVLVGMGSSGVLIIAIFLLADLTSLGTLPLWRSVLVVVQSCGFMLGSPIGSLIAKAASWHIPFFIEAALSAIAGIILFAGFHRITSRAKKTKLSVLPSGTSDGRKFDTLGSTVLLVAVVTPLIALNLGGNALPWGHPLIIVLLSLTLPLFVGFGLIETFVAAFPLLPLQLLRSRLTLKVLLCTALTIYARNQFDIHISFYTEIRSSPESPLSNWILTCHFLGISLGSICSGVIISYYKRFKWVLVVATMIALLLYVGMATGMTHPENPIFIPALILFGASLGAVHNCLIVGMLCNSKKEDRTTTYALFELVVAVSADTAIAVSSTLQRQWFISGMHAVFGADKEAQQLISKSLKSLGYVRNLPNDTQQRILQCFVVALQKVFSVSCVLLCVSVLIALSLQDIPCDQWLEADTIATISEDS
ncbi:MFS general substrate transporter [Aulographum hederae CBS 113979]|uniref:MFS general substrate transporter n=1 Tax=Aulographum hederae CBS 113979 TaxID=1176131 RepID=A0A6G1HAM2_9PEZI|nr:MFS general substrate transporter [Aulographum hederae CBS 113979]